MNKRSLATISGLLSFTIGTGLVLIFGVHSPMMSQCSKRSDGSLLAMHMQASPDQSNLIFFPCSFKVFHLVSTGALSWSGRVTGKSRIVIQRSNLNFQILTGTIDTDSQRFTSSMLTAPFPVRLRTITGIARLIQRPDPSNGFVTVIQVEGNQDRVSFILDWPIAR